MDVRQTIHAFSEHAKELLVVLRSPEGKALSRGDLDTLEIQLYLLEKEVTKRKEGNPSSS